MPAPDRLLRLLDGPPPRLPAPIDALAERWAGARPRSRLLAGLVLVTVAAALVGRGAARSPWGPPVTVVVAAEDLAAGAVVAAAQVRVARWPADVVPDGTLHDPGEVVGLPLAVGAPAGTPLTARHVAPGGIAAGLAPGRAAVPLPLPEGATVSAGQLVDVLAGDASGGGALLASGARVLSADGGVLWLDVDRAEAPAVAGAAAWGRVTVAVLPPGHR